METATAVVGLVGAGAKISLLLEQFISGCVNAPALVQTVHCEIKDFNSILSLLQPFLLGLSPLSQSRASMIYVDQLVVTVTECVCTLSEIEKEVDGLKPNGKMGIWDRLKWSRMEPAVFQLSQRLLSHKSSLNLILTILSSPSLPEATDCAASFHEQLVGDTTYMIPGDQSTNTESSPAEGHLGLDSDVGSSESIKTVTRAVKFYHLTCESILFTTRPYRGRSNRCESMISFTSSQRQKPSWSLISGGSNRSVLSLPVSNYEFSGLSLAEASDMSTLPLPVPADKLRNPRLYGAAGTSPPNPTPTVKSLELITQLHRAAKLGEMGLIWILLGQGVDIEARDEDGNSTIHIAAKNNCASTIVLLLNLGADIQSRTHRGDTPLHSAARNDQEPAVGLLLRRGADIEAKNQRRHPITLRSAE